MYTAFVTPARGGVSIAFPDFPGLRASAGSRARASAAAREALDAHIGSILRRHQVPPRPGRHATPAGSTALQVPLQLHHAIPIELRRIRTARGLSLQQVAERMGVTRQRVARLEGHESNVTLSTLLRLGEALGAELSVQFHARPPAPRAGESPRRRGSRGASRRDAA